MASRQGMRMTRQRQVILDELKRTKAHPTADEVYARVRRRLPRISLGTVYRNLDLLSEMGMIQKLELAGRQKRFDGTPDEHYHVRCTCCGRVDDVPGKTDAAIVARIRRKLKYRITGHRLEFTGICPACAAKARRRKGATSSRAKR